jgi:hypothetical protein
MHSATRIERDVRVTFCSLPWPPDLKHYIWSRITLRIRKILFTGLCHMKAASFSVIPGVFVVRVMSSARSLHSLVFPALFAEIPFLTPLVSNFAVALLHDGYINIGRSTHRCVSFETCYVNPLLVPRNTASGKCCFCNALSVRAYAISI